MVDHPLEAIVAERLDAAAVIADEMVVMVPGRLVVCPAGSKLEPVNKAELGKCLEGAVDARDADARTAAPNASVDRRNGETAILPGEDVNHGRACAARLVSRLSEGGMGFLSPAHETK